MGTNLTAIKSSDEQRNDIVLSYAPICLFLKNKQFYETKIETKNIKSITMDRLGDLNVAPINSQDSEIQQITSGRQSKSFNKHAFLVEYRESLFQAESALPVLNNRAVRELSMVFDKQVWNGIYNNGLYVSTDSNYITEGSSQTLPVVSGNNGIDKVAEIFTDELSKIEATTASNDVLVYVYGRSLKQYLRKIYQATGGSYLDVIKANFPQCTLVEVPENIEADTNKGFLFVSQEMVTLHHQSLPELWKSAEGTIDISNFFLFGSAFVDVMEYGAIRQQAITIAS